MIGYVNNHASPFHSIPFSVLLNFAENKKILELYWKGCSSFMIMAAKNLPKVKQFSESLATYQKGFHDENACKSMVYSTFGKTGLDVSLLGFGGAHLAKCYENSQEQEGIETVIEAVKSGINYIDTAPYYGDEKAEIVLGKALKHIPRNTYYVATKVGRYHPQLERMFDFSAERTLKSVEGSLSRLGVEYIDILQVHDVEYAKNIDIVINETLPTLQKLKDQGKCKFIGITGYPISVLQEILERSTVEIDMVLSYCRCTLFDNTLKSFIPGFKERNLGIVNAALLGIGLLTHHGPPDWHHSGAEMKETCKKAAQYCKEQNVNISRLAAAYSYSQPDINVHLIGMEKKELLRINLSALHDDLTPHEETVLKEIQTRYFNKLTTTHWENSDVAAYWEYMRNYNNK